MPPDIGDIKPSLPAPLVMLVRACLQKNPADRPQDASVVLDLLDGVATPLSGTRVPVVQKTVPTRKSGGRWMEVLAVPVAYIVAAGGVLAYLLRLAEQERIRDGIVAAGVIGSLIGLPIAVAGGFLLRVVGVERAK